MVSDINFFDDARIKSDDNKIVAVNIANWLASGRSGVLLFVDEPTSANYYRTQVASAFNELGVNYFHTYTFDYFNLFLKLCQWDMVIIDAQWKTLTT